MVRGTVPTQYMMVFFKAALKKMSSPSFLKLVKPAHWIGLLPSHLRNASAKAKIIGTNVNTQNPIKLGAIKEYATKSLLVSRLNTLPDFILSICRLCLPISAIILRFFFSSVSVRTSVISCVNSPCKRSIFAVFADSSIFGIHFSPFRS